MPNGTAVLNGKDKYKNSRILYLFEASFANLIDVLANGAYLAKLTSEIGISDGMTAILTALTSLAGIAQLVTIRLAGKATYKRTVIGIMIPAELIFASLYLIPFLNLGAVGMSVIFFIAMLSARILESVIMPLKVTWFMNLVPIENRGEYTSVLRITSALGTVIVSFAAGFVIDYFDSQDNIECAFLVLCGMILFFTLSNLLTLALSREKEREVKTGNANLSSNLKHLLKEKTFTKLILILLLAAVGNNVITPFTGTYKINELGFTMTFISTLTSVSTIIRILTMYVFGRLSRRISHETILNIGYAVTFVGFLINIFSSPKAPFLYVIFSVLNSVSVGVLAISSTNIILELFTREHQAAAISVSTIATGFLAFLSTIAVSPFVSFMQSRGNQLFGITVYAQQLLSALAAFFYLVLIIYYNLSFLPEKRKKS